MTYKKKAGEGVDRKEILEELAEIYAKQAAAIHKAQGFISEEFMADEIESVFKLILKIIGFPEREEDGFLDWVRLEGIDIDLENGRHKPRIDWLIKEFNGTNDE